MNMIESLLSSVIYDDKHECHPNRNEKSVPDGMYIQFDAAGQG